MQSPTPPNPLVTICITSYRRPSLAIHCLLSCVSQTYRPLEIEVSDDSPTDDTEIALRLVPVPDGITVCYRRNTPSLGEPNNVNSLFRNARGKYSILLHDDDLLLPGAVQVLMAGISSHLHAVAAFGMNDVIINSGEFSRSITERTNIAFRRVPALEGAMPDSLVSALWRQFPNDGYLIETEAARAVGYRTREEIGGAGDTDFAIRLALAYPERPFVFLATPVSCYRDTVGNASSTMTGKVLKLYRFLLTIPIKNVSQEQARKELLGELAHQAVSDNALLGKRLEAIRILTSQYYSHKHYPLRSTYHTALIMFPVLHRLKLAASHITKRVFS